MTTTRYLVIIYIILAVLAWAQWGNTATVHTNGKIKVMVMDTGVDLTWGMISSHIPDASKYPSNVFSDANGHGTHIAGIILENTCQQVELVPCKLYTTNEYKQANGNVDAVVKCLNLAIKENVDIVNFSGGGTDWSRDEFNKISELNKLNITLVAAGGNNGKNLDLPDPQCAHLTNIPSEYIECEHEKGRKFYPAMYNLPNIIAVGNLDTTLTKALTSNYSLKFVWEVGTNVLGPASAESESFSLKMPRFKIYRRHSGTSQAAAVHTHKMLMKMCEELTDNKK